MNYGLTIIESETLMNKLACISYGPSHLIPNFFIIKCSKIDEVFPLFDVMHAFLFTAFRSELVSI